MTYHYLRSTGMLCNPILANPKGLPRSIPPPVLPTNIVKQLSQSQSFDDYHEGPTKEDMIQDNWKLGDIHTMYTFDPAIYLLVPSKQTLFADHGYCLMSGFAQMYYNVDLRPSPVTSLILGLRTPMDMIQPLTTPTSIATPAPHPCQR